MSTSLSQGFWRKSVLLFSLYAGFAVFYMYTLHLSIGGSADEAPSYNILYLDYPLKAVFTLPIWYLLFRVLNNWSLERKLLINLILMPVWVKGWQWTYYWILENVMDRYHLEGPGEWWDVYIPGLFYVLQFGIFHAWDNYERLLRKEREKAEVERLALLAELDALKAQLNPHFLYNSLNTISASIGPEQEGARKMIGMLGDLFRYQLVANRREEVRLREELDFVQDYLLLEQARFGDRLRFKIMVADDDPVRSALIPPLLLQPLVENAVRHGISPSVIGGEVTIAAEINEAFIVFTVFNTGKPVDTEKARSPSGFGLKNTRRRLQLLYDTPLDLFSDEQGTFCSFSIPLSYEKDHSTDRRRSTRPAVAQGIPH